VKINIKSRKKVVWKERFNLWDHFSVGVLEGLEERQKNFYFLVGQVRFHAVLVAGFRMDDVP
jgi:hypothetical protein